MSIALMGKIFALHGVYAFSFTIFHTKKERKETAKQIMPNVSSRGQGAKCVRPIESVSGCTMAISAIYTHPAKPKTKSVRDTARIIFMLVS